MLKNLNPLGFGSQLLTNQPNYFRDFFSNLLMNSLTYSNQVLEGINYRIPYNRICIVRISKYDSAVFFFYF